VLRDTLSKRSFFARSKRWPTVCGTIHDSSIRTITGHGDVTDLDFYHPYIYYHYEINGKEYINLDIVHSLVSDEGKARQLVTEYKVGMKVSVFYNPKKPKESTLNTSYNKDKIGGYWIIVILLAIGALCFGLAFIHG
jgi:hypothetical protein